jgi:hypothetical protein
MTPTSHGYAIATLLPSESIFCYVSELRSLRKLNCEESTDFNKGLDTCLHSIRIRYYPDVQYPHQCKSLSYQEVGDICGFEYFPFLKFFHEKDLRNLWIHEIPNISEQGSNMDNIDSSCFTPFLSEGRIHPSLALKRIGIFDGIDMGHGLFAEEVIPTCVFLGEYCGMVSFSTSTIKQQHTTDHLSFSCEYPSCDGSLSINAEEVGNMIRFINHSDSPNSMFTRFYCDGLSHILCVSYSFVSYRCCLPFAFLYLLRSPFERLR